MLTRERLIDTGGRTSLFLILFILFLLLGGTILWRVIIRIRTPDSSDYVELAPAVDIIWSMYETSASGDIEGYLACFVPESQNRIKETLKSKGEKGFRDFLSSNASGILGISIKTTGKGDLAKIKGNPGSITIPVEMVFKSRNEVQIFNLKLINGSWRIVDVSSPLITPQPIPYGKNVNE